MSDTVLVEFQSDHGPILVEIRESHVGHLPAAAGDIEAHKSNQKFMDAIAGIEPIARAVMQRIEGLAATEATVEFGLKLTGKAGVVLASAETEGHFKITLAWKKKQ